MVVVLLLPLLLCPHLADHQPEPKNYQRPKAEQRNPFLHADGSLGVLQMIPGRINGDAIT